MVCVHVLCFFFDDHIVIVEDFDCIVGRIGHLLLFAETSAAGKFDPVVEGLTETAGKVDSFKSEAALVIIGKFMSFAPTKITSQLAAKVAVWLPLIEERCVSVNSGTCFVSSFPHQ